MSCRISLLQVSTGPADSAPGDVAGTGIVIEGLKAGPGGQLCSRSLARPPQKGRRLPRAQIAIAVLGDISFALFVPSHPPPWLQI